MCCIRLLRHEYGADHVTYARNFTDVDDKINARAAEVAKAKGISVEAARAELTATRRARNIWKTMSRPWAAWTANERAPRATEHIARH